MGTRYPKSIHDFYIRRSSYFIANAKGVKHFWASLRRLLAKGDTRCWSHQGQDGQSMSRACPYQMMITSAMKSMGAAVNIYEDPKRGGGRALRSTPSIPLPVFMGWPPLLRGRNSQSSCCERHLNTGPINSTLRLIILSREEEDLAKPQLWFPRRCVTGAPRRNFMPSPQTAPLANSQQTWSLESTVWGDRLSVLSIWAASECQAEQPVKFRRAANGLREYSIYTTSTPPLLIPHIHSGRSSLEPNRGGLIVSTTNASPKDRGTGSS
jgi:hypothetical protein